MTEQTTKPEGVCTADRLHPPGGGGHVLPRLRRAPAGIRRAGQYGGVGVRPGVLGPWVEGVEPIGSEELTRVMRGALEEAEREFNLAQDELEAAEAAL